MALSLQHHDHAEQPVAELGCDEAEALLPLVADGALDAAADPALFEHLSRCDACQHSLIMHDLVELAVGDGRQSPSTRGGWRRLGPVALAASLLGAAALGYGIWQFRAAFVPAESEAAAPSEVVDVRLGPDGTPQLRLRRDGRVQEIQQIDGRALPPGEASVGGPRMAVPATLPRESSPRSQDR